MTTPNATMPPRDPEGRLRLALIELDRLEREIDTLTPRARDAADHDLLASLRACRAALLRMADVRFAWHRRDARAPSLTAS